MTNEKKRDWFKSSFPAEGADHFVGFKREYLNVPLSADLYRFMSLEGSTLEPDFAALNPLCSLELTDWIFRDLMFTEDKIAAFDLELYQDKNRAIYFNGHPKNGQWTNKQMFMIRYLEMLVMDIWINASKKLLSRQKLVACRKYFKSKFGFTPELNDSYEDRLSYLYSSLDFFENIKTKEEYDPEWSSFNIHSVKRFITKLTDLPDNLFTSDDKALISIRDGFNKEVFECMNCIDKERMWLHGEHILFKVRYQNLSAGELEFISGFANLYQAIEAVTTNSKVDTLILLLDEPDASFHPEWSRRYIRNLVSFLNGIEIGRSVNFQIMMTTHSPFVVSDVPKPFITCLELKRDEDGSYTRIVKKADFGLMSNIYDILRSDFFISSPIGEQAKQFFNKLTTRIDQLHNYDSDEMMQLRGLVTAIGEPFIQAKLMEQLEETERRLMPIDVRERRIRELQNQIDQLKQLDGDDTRND